MTAAVDRTPLVSVVVPCFNADLFLGETIESVLAQTYRRWELLLVDDGSTDGSAAVGRRYAQQYPDMVRCLAHPARANRGACASRNLGIRHARGHYIALLDADDVWQAGKLERQVAILGCHPEASMLYGAAQYWYSWTGKPEDAGRDTVPALGVATDTVVEPPGLLKLAAPLGRAITPCPSTLIFRRDMLERVGGFEEAFHGIYQLYEDRAFLSKVYLHEPVFVAGECWAWYRQHPASCVSRVKTAGQQRSARLFFLTWLEAYLTKCGVNDPMIRRPLQRALWPYRHPILQRLRSGARRYAASMRGLVGGA